MYVKPRGVIRVVYSLRGWSTGSFNLHVRRSVMLYQSLEGITVRVKIRLKSCGLRYNVLGYYYVYGFRGEANDSLKQRSVTPISSLYSIEICFRHIVCSFL